MEANLVDLIKLCNKYIDKENIGSFLNDFLDLTNYDFEDLCTYDEEEESLIYSLNNEDLITKYMEINLEDDSDYTIKTICENYANNIPILIKLVEKRMSAEDILDSPLVKWVNTSFDEILSNGYVDFDSKIIAEDSPLSKDIVLTLFKQYATENHWYKNINRDLYVEDNYGLTNCLTEERFTFFTLGGLLEDFGIPFDYIKLYWSEGDDEVDEEYRLYDKDGNINYNMVFDSMSEIADMFLEKEHEIYEQL